LTGPSPGPSTTPGTYLFDNRGPETPDRFRGLSASFDGWTIQHLERVGVAPGWRCFELGAGGGSIARWLADRVGPTGHVLATDVDPRHLAGLAGPNLEVREHDIVEDPVPEGPFDLVHTRLVLQHVPQRRRVVRKLVGLLRPGGWAVLEDFALQPHLYSLGDRESARLFRAGDQAVWKAFRDRGADPGFGRALPGLLVRAGLEEVNADAYATLWRGGTPGAAVLAANYRQARESMLATGKITDESLERLLHRLEEPGNARFSSLLVSAWGRRPAAEAGARAPAPADPT
jgi:SAM-dependent methyltransferase